MFFKIIAWFAKNHLVANLMVAMVLLLGVWSVMDRITFEVSPAIEIKEVWIRAEYRGGTPADIERAVVIPIEKSLEGLPGIESVESQANMNMGFIRVRVDQFSDPKILLEEIRPRVEAITNFPQEMEPPKIELPMTSRWQDVMKVAILGDLTETELLVAARRVRDDITNLDSISQAEVLGASPKEISIEADAKKLQAYGLTFSDLTEAVRRSSLDLPAGQIQTDEGSMMIRTQGQAYLDTEFANITLKNNQGAEVKLLDVARVSDGFEEQHKILRLNGKPCLMVAVNRLNNEDAIKISNKVKDYVERSAGKFPQGIALRIYDDASIELRGRLASLAQKLLEGCVLVVIVLGLFLRPRIAFIVLLGIPFSFAGTLFLMPIFGFTINVMTLFAFIIVLGLVADDAIVTAENIYSKMKAGRVGLDAAIKGTREIAIPVTFGTFTTIVAFLPLMFFDGWYGSLTKMVTPIVVCALIFSLLEAKLALPSQMKFVKHIEDDTGFISRMQRKVADGLENFVQRYFKPLVIFTTKHRYATVAGFFSLFLASMGLITSGRMGFASMPAIEKNRIMASITMNRDATVEETDVQVKRIADAAEKLRSEYVDPATGESVIIDILSSAGGWIKSPGVDARQGNVSMIVKDPSLRSTPGPKSAEIAKRWTELCGDTSMIQSFMINVDKGQGFRGFRGGNGENLELELRGPASDARDDLAEEIVNTLKSYNGVKATDSSLSKMKEELLISIRPEGEALGLTQRELGRQMRAAFYGDQAQRVQRDVDDIRVMIRLPLAERRSLHTLETMRIKTPNGGNAPLATIADIRFDKARSEITRTDGQQSIGIWAGTENDKVDVMEIANDLAKKIDALLLDHPELSWRYKGYIADHQKTQHRLVIAGISVLLGLYLLLVLPFRSLLQPLYILLAIPFGVIGALLGHLFMGITPSFLSAFGILSVAGIVVNNAIVMIDFINQNVAKGHTVFDSVVNAGTKRFRPIMLTSLTNFVGLVPSMFDKSIQGQVLVPMATSLAWGILFSTIITLFLIPAIYLIVEAMKEKLYGACKAVFQNK